MAALTQHALNGMTKDQHALMVRIRDLGLKEKELTDRINKLFAQGSYPEGGAVVLCEDWDDFRVINMGKTPEMQHPLYREYNELQGQIKGVLIAAQQRGLGKFGIIQRQAANYGVTLDDFDKAIINK